MPKLAEIRTNRAKQSWLNQIMRSITNPEPGEGESNEANNEDYSALIAPLVPQIEAANGDWVTANRALISAYNARRAAVASCNEAIEKLSSLVKQGRALLRHRVETEKFTNGLAETFGLKKAVPNTHTSRAWLQLAKDMIIGDEEAVKAEHRPMKMPSATVLQSLYDEADKACKAVDQADHQHQEAQRAMRVISDEVRELAQDTSAYLRYKLRRLQAPEQRRIMRKFGYVYQGDASVTEEPETAEISSEKPVSTDPVLANNPETSEQTVRAQNQSEHRSQQLAAPRLKAELKAPPQAAPDTPGTYVPMEPLLPELSVERLFPDLSASGGQRQSGTVPERKRREAGVEAQSCEAPISGQVPST